jgi:hypothetical protein
LSLALATTAVCGCSGSSAASASVNENDGSPMMSGDESDSAASSSATDGGGGSTSDAPGTADAKGTTTSGVDAGDTAAGQAGANVYCTAVCDREAACLSVAVDASMCHCSAGTLTLYRNDYVTKLAACESAASCEDLLSTDGSADSGLDMCAESALAQITATATVTAFCSQLGLSTCAGDAVPDCPDTFKVYNDGTVNALSTCIADPHCGDHAACVSTALTP